MTTEQPTTGPDDFWDMPRQRVTAPLHWILTLSATWIPSDGAAAERQSHTATFNGVLDVDLNSPPSRGALFEQLYRQAEADLLPPGADLVTSHVLFFEIRPPNPLRG